MAETRTMNRMGMKQTQRMPIPHADPGIRPQETAHGDGGGHPTDSMVAGDVSADPMALRPNAKTFSQAESTGRMSESEATKHLHPNTMGDAAAENRQNATTPSRPGVREGHGKGRGRIGQAD